MTADPLPERRPCRTCTHAVMRFGARIACRALPAMDLHRVTGCSAHSDISEDPQKEKEHVA